MELTLAEATVMPLVVSDNVKDIAEDAMQAAFALIAARLERCGYPVTGDVAPDEAHQLDNAFQGFVLSMALNNPKIAEMQDATLCDLCGGSGELEDPDDQSQGVTVYFPCGNCDGKGTL